MLAAKPFRILIGFLFHVTNGTEKFAIPVYNSASLFVSSNENTK
jgi:hypothetical protein